MLAVLSKFSNVFSKNKTVCRDAEADYLPLVKISHMGHVTDHLVTSLHTLTIVAVKILFVYSSLTKRLLSLAQEEVKSATLAAYMSMVLFSFGNIFFLI